MEITIKITDIPNFAEMTISELYLYFCSLHGGVVQDWNFKITSCKLDVAKLIGKLKPQLSLFF